jgi:hypothetical protein
VPAVPVTVVPSGSVFSEVVSVGPVGATSYHTVRLVVALVEVVQLETAGLLATLYVPARQPKRFNVMWEFVTDCGLGEVLYEKLEPVL